VFQYTRIHSLLINGVVTASSHALWRVLSNKVIWVLGHVQICRLWVRHSPCCTLSYKLFWNWNGVVWFVSQEVWFDKGFVIWHFLNFCLVQIMSLWSLSIGVGIFLTTNELVDRTRIFKSNASRFKQKNMKKCAAGHIFYELWVNKNIYDLQSLIDCDPIWSPAPETIYEERPWDRGCTVSLDFFWQVLSPLYFVPSPPALPCCRFLETLLVATACSCYFLCQAWQTWASFLVFVQRACCHTGASRWSGGQP